MAEKENYNISAEKFVYKLLNVGSRTRCDDSNDEFDRNNKVPPFYNDKLYRKGQEFICKHIFSVIICNFLGLIAILAIPSILKILTNTGMSSSNLTAYKRYTATVFHMMIWYDKDLKPGSKSWKSLAVVRNMHNSASKKSTKKKIGSITQEDMAFAHFASVSFVLLRGPELGIYGATEEELRGFVHFWRVLGYLLGIEDRFNICNGSVEETKEICRLLIKHVFRPEIAKKDEDFLTMSCYLCNGMSAMDPFIMYAPLMCALDILIQDNIDGLKPTYLKLNFWQSLAFNTGIYLFHTMQFSIVRLLLNCIRIFQLRVTKRFPLLAYFRYGFVNIISDMKVPSL